MRQSYLGSHVCDFTFLCSVVIWYDIFLHITLQSIDVEVTKAVSLPEKTKDGFMSIIAVLNFKDIYWTPNTWKWKTPKLGVQYKLEGERLKHNLILI